jgi:hypothetical protein
MTYSSEFKNKNLTNLYYFYPNKSKPINYALY